jgi:hypothetical protein
MQALSFPIADLIIAICRRAEPDRNTIVHTLIDNIKEKAAPTYVFSASVPGERERKRGGILLLITSYRPSKALGYLTQTLTLLLMDDITARKIVAESDVVTILLDLLARTMRSKEKETAEKKDSDLPKWVPTLLLTIDSLAQLPVAENPPEVCAQFHEILLFSKP